MLQVDQQFADYLANKQACRLENLSKYACEQDFAQQTQQAVCQTLIQHLCSAYPQFFSQPTPRQLHCQLTGEQLQFRADGQLHPHPKYQNMLDALAAQVQEDIAVWQLQAEQDWLAALHVCSPNGWAPAEKVGKNFDELHQQVPGMQKMRQHYLPMLKGLIQKPAFSRFIWDLKTRPQLNLHPQAPTGISAADWELPAFEPEAPELYVRVERQVLFGLPNCNAVLFLIRTYHYAVRELDSNGLHGLLQAIAGMPPELLAYKKIADSAGDIQDWLQSLLKHPNS